VVDGRLPFRAQLDERSLCAQQLDLLCFAGRNASFGRAQYDVQDGLKLVVDFLRAIRQEEIEVRRSDLGLDVELLLTEIASAIAASALAMSVRAPRFPPSGCSG